MVVVVRKTVTKPIAPVAIIIKVLLPGYIERILVLQSSTHHERVGKVMSLLEVVIGGKQSFCRLYQA